MGMNRAGKCVEEVIRIGKEYNEKVKGVYGSLKTLADYRRGEKEGITEWMEAESERVRGEMEREQKRLEETVKRLEEMGGKMETLLARLKGEKERKGEEKFKTWTLKICEEEVEKVVNVYKEDTKVRAMLVKELREGKLDRMTTVLIWARRIEDGIKRLEIMWNAEKEWNLD